MPLQLSIGFSKKQGLPGYGSLGTSCNVTLELDQFLLTHDLEKFQRHVKHAYLACSQAVNDELARQQALGSGDRGNGQRNEAAPRQEAPSQGSDNDGNGKGHTNVSPGASQKQIEYIDQLAHQIPGLGVWRLETLANNLFEKPLVELTSVEASLLIDTLKGIKEGRVELETALNGAPT